VRWDDQGLRQGQNDRRGVPVVLPPKRPIDGDERRPRGVLVEVVVNRLQDGLLFRRQGCNLRVHLHYQLIDTVVMGWMVPVSRGFGVSVMREPPVDLRHLILSDSGASSSAIFSDPDAVSVRSVGYVIRNIEFEGEDMSASGTGREEIVVVLPPEPPELNPEAARVLLRILLKAYEKQCAGGDGSARVRPSASEPPD
jgi:hypothetical protein